MAHLRGGWGVIKVLPLFQAHVKQKNDVMAAMYCLEIAHRLKVHNLDEVQCSYFNFFVNLVQHFKKYHEAVTFFQKAVGYQTQVDTCLQRPKLINFLCFFFTIATRVHGADNGGGGQLQNQIK